MKLKVKHFTYNPDADGFYLCLSSESEWFLAERKDGDFYLCDAYMDRHYINTPIDVDWAVPIPDPAIMTLKLGMNKMREEDYYGNSGSAVYRGNTESMLHSGYIGEWRAAGNFDWSSIDR